MFNQPNLHSRTTKYLIDRVSFKQIHDSPFLFDPIQIDFTSPTPLYVYILESSNWPLENDRVNSLPRKRRNVCPFPWRELSPHATWFKFWGLVKGLDINQWTFCLRYRNWKMTNICANGVEKRRLGQSPSLFWLSNVGLSL